jgi:hypothetical protein
MPQPSRKTLVDNCRFAPANDTEAWMDRVADATEQPGRGKDFHRFTCTTCGRTQRIPFNDFNLFRRYAFTYTIRGGPGRWTVEEASCDGCGSTAVTVEPENVVV